MTNKIATSIVKRRQLGRCFVKAAVGSYNSMPGSIPGWSEPTQAVLAPPSTPTAKGGEPGVVGSFFNGLGQGALNQLNAVGNFAWGTAAGIGGGIGAKAVAPFDPEYSKYLSQLSRAGARDAINSFGQYVGLYNAWDSNTGQYRGAQPANSVEGAVDAIDQRYFSNPADADLRAGFTGGINTAREASKAIPAAAAAGPVLSRVSAIPAVNNAGQAVSRVVPPLAQQAISYTTGIPVTTNLNPYLFVGSQFAQSLAMPQDAIPGWTGLPGAQYYPANAIDSATRQNFGSMAPEMIDSFIFPSGATSANLLLSGANTALAPSNELARSANQSESANQPAQSTPASVPLTTSSLEDPFDDNPPPASQQPSPALPQPTPATTTAQSTSSNQPGGNSAGAQSSGNGADTTETTTDAAKQTQKPPAIQQDAVEKSLADAAAPGASPELRAKAENDLRQFVSAQAEANPAMAAGAKAFLAGDYNNQDAIAFRQHLDKVGNNVMDAKLRELYGETPNPTPEQAGGMFAQAQEFWTSLPTESKVMLGLGLPLGIVGVGSMLFGGGMFGLLAGVLGLGAAGMIGANAGMFGDDARKLVGQAGLGVMDALGVKTPDVSQLAGLNEQEVQKRVQDALESGGAEAAQAELDKIREQVGVIRKYNPDVAVTGMLARGAVPDSESGYSLLSKGNKFLEDTSDPNFIYNRAMQQGRDQFGDIVRERHPYLSWFANPDYNDRANDWFWGTPEQRDARIAEELASRYKLQKKGALAALKRATSRWAT